MPFELMFEEPPSVSPRGVILADRRTKLRKAIGEPTIERALELFESAVEMDAADQSERRIALHPSGLLEDLKHDWPAQPVIDLFDAIRTVADIDLANDGAVGSTLRTETGNLVSRADVVFELLKFVDMFESSIVHTLIRPAYIDGLWLTASLVEWMTAEEDAVSADRAALFDLKAAELQDHHIVLCGLPYADRVDPVEPSIVTYENEFELLIGVKFPTGVVRQIDVYRHFEATGYNLCELGSRQLPYFGPYQATDRIWAHNFFDLGLRIGKSAYPLLAHRAAFLAWDLIERATAADEAEALATIHVLFDGETLWMVDSQQDYFGAIERYQAGDQAAVVEAYGDLAEGTLRRYGSLIVALERVADGAAPQQPLVLESLNDVETQLGVHSEHLLPALILRFLERGLRNADAHANVVVDLNGNLMVRQRDGTIETVIPNQVYGRTAGLRSVLDGVDIAMNHASIRDREVKPVDLATEPMPPTSEHLFQRVVGEFAQIHTPGWVTNVARRDETLTITYHGPPATYDQLRAFANSLIRLLGPNLPVIHVLDEQGKPIEIFRPPPRRDPVGRNDPCPCGSGRKYKKCHGGS